MYIDILSKFNVFCKDKNRRADGVSLGSDWIGGKFKWAYLVKAWWTKNPLPLGGGAVNLEGAFQVRDVLTSSPV